MSKFKVGDRVKLITKRHGDHGSNPVWNGEMGQVGGTISRVGDDGSFPLKVAWDNRSTNSYEEGDLKLLTSELKIKTITMNILETIKLVRKSEPEKTLVKAGLMNLDESLTSEGQSVLNDLLIQEFKTKLKDAADLILKEKEDKK